MNSLKNLFSILIILGIMVAVFSCKDDDPEPLAVQSEIVADLDADYAPFGPPPVGAPPPRIGETKKFTLFSFATGEIVANADSASSNWDIGFRDTSIIINGGTSGPGEGEAQVVSGIFEDIAEVPATGFVADNDPSPIAGAPNPNLAIPTGSGNGWYTYDGASMTVAPTAGKVILVKTADGHYAKMEILSYYKGSPATPNAMSDQDRYYTFRYVYQPNASTKFSN